MTKRLIKEAYIELSTSNPDKRLSITDICNCADINRSTFYMHYEDINHLVREIEDELIFQIPNVTGVNSIKTDKEFLNLLEKTFEYVRNNKDVFIMLLTKFDSNDFKKRLISTILDFYKSIPINADTILSKYGYLYCINGILGLLQEWINDDFPISSRQLAQIALDMSVRATSIN